MGHSYDGAERREDFRVFKHYSLLFKYKDSPEKRSDVTFIQDISQGGVRFTISQPIKSGTGLLFEIGVPYIAPRKLFLEGLVIASKEITPKLVYEIRAKFNSLDEETIKILEMIEKQNKKD